MAQQLPQQYLGESGCSQIADLYEEAIQATISQCQLLQNNKVLAAIEKQWRLSLRRKQMELSMAAAAVSLAAEETAAAAGQKPPAAAAAAEAAAAAAAAETAATAADSCAAISNTSETQQSASSIPSSNSAKSGDGVCENASGELQTKTAEDSDDEFADADIDEAEDQLPPAAAAAAAGDSSAAAAAAPVQNAAQQQQQQQQGNRRRSTQQDDSEEEDEEEGANMSVNDVSDLDDAEPSTTDGIFAFFEKVERASAGSSRRCSKWKVSLRHGILRVGGREIPFDRATGEFSF